MFLKGNEGGFLGLIVGGFFLSVFLLATLFTLIYIFIAQPHKVSGNAMFPVLQNGQYFITNKFIYKTQIPQRGDIVVFKNPLDASQDLIKRVIGIPGDKVKIEQGMVYVNDLLLDESYLPSDIKTNPGNFLREGSEVLVESDNFILLGDNRPHSSDSREWGFVPKGNIIGKFWFRY